MAIYKKGKISKIYQRNNLINKVYLNNKVVYQDLFQVGTVLWNENRYFANPNTMYTLGTPPKNILDVGFFNKDFNPERLPNGIAITVSQYFQDNNSNTSWKYTSFGKTFKAFVNKIDLIAQRKSDIFSPIPFEVYTNIPRQGLQFQYLGGQEFAFYIKGTDIRSTEYCYDYNGTRDYRNLAVISKIEAY